MTEPAVTCLVPTHNRANFLRRWLRFYREFPPGFAVTVVDSSGPSAAAENVALVEAARGSLKIQYQHLDLDLMTKCQQALETTTTPFVTLCADDDLVFPDAVAKCAEFLARNSGYSSALGRTAKVYPNRRWFGRVRLKGYSIEDDDPLVRCRRLAGNFFTNYYAVYPLDTLRANFRLVSAHTDSRTTYALAEMLLSQLSAIRGRIKVLPFMHLVLERHPAMAGVLCRGQQWNEVEAHYQRFKQCLVEEFANAGVERAKAGEYVDEQFVHFRDPNLLHRLRKRSLGEALQHHLRAACERVEDRFQNEGVRHRRPIRAGDIAGSETIWKAAVQIMRDHPDGIPANAASETKVK
jgi:glycosyltransferase domain-containing protein